jgi:CRP/FNR family cyclic AMP-dependent transcriptional regulator
MTQTRPQAPVKTLQENEILFHENEKGREMAVVRKGRLIIETGSGNKKKTIAELGVGSIVGEMALIDGMPRSASVRALSSAEVNIIDSSFFEQMMSHLPHWLAEIFKMITSRLRDADKRLDQSSVKNKIQSLAVVIQHLIPRHQKPNQLSVYIPWFNTMDTFCLWTGLNRIDLEAIAKNFCITGIIEFGRNDAGDRLLVVNEPNVLNLYLEFLDSLSQGIKHLPYALDERVIGVFDFLAIQFPVSHLDIQKSFDENQVLDHMKNKNSHWSLSHLEKLVHLQCLSREDGKITFYYQGINKLKLCLAWKSRFEESLL